MQWVLHALQAGVADVAHVAGKNCRSDTSCRPNWAAGVIHVIAGRGCEYHTWGRLRLHVSWPNLIVLAGTGKGKCHSNVTSSVVIL